MKVVAARAEVLDLGESLLNEVSPTTEGVVRVTGGGVFDDDERLLPHVSCFLSEQASTDKLSIKSVKTYGHNLGYIYSFLQSRPELKSCKLDEAFIDAGTHIYREYFRSLIEESDLESTTARNRDATLMSFMANYLCASVDGRAPLRKSNPYDRGMFTPSPKSKLIQGCSTEELMALIESTPYERERCLMQFIFDVGLRRSEVEFVSLKSVLDALKFSKAKFLSQDEELPLHVDYCPIWISGSKGRGNQRKARYSIVSRATLERVKRYHDSLVYRTHSRKYRKPEDTPAFFNTHGDAFSARAISSLLDRLSERAVATNRITRPVSPHKLRHGNAYAILSSPDLGTDYLERLTIASKSLGHAHLSTTEKYNQIAMDLYRKLLDDNAITVTRAQEMEALIVKTWLRIRPSDRK
ncbi:tyrosine-type recombinase/integrase [Pseudomonas rhodesiae]|uniref:tyrosine-type recombinase/integrase n=1 Tax=Pseudomonas rhodesiae TaxID=76760 RepID=UPI0032B17A50